MEKLSSKKSQINPEDFLLTEMDTMDWLEMTDKHTETLQLIESFRKRPNLWLRKHESYNVPDTKRSSLREVAEEIGLDGSKEESIITVVKKWKNLYDSFMRSYKKIPHDKRKQFFQNPDDVALEEWSRWRYFPKLFFLAANYSHGEFEEDQETDVNKRKRKISSEERIEVVKKATPSYILYDSDNSSQRLSPKTTRNPAVITPTSIVNPKVIKPNRTSTRSKFSIKQSPSLSLPSCNPIVRDVYLDRLEGFLKTISETIFHRHDKGLLFNWASCKRVLFEKLNEVEQHELLHEYDRLLLEKVKLKAQEISEASKKEHNYIRTSLPILNLEETTCSTMVVEEIKDTLK